MGSSVSSLEAAQAFSSLLTDDSIDEQIESILNCALGSVDMTQAFPIESIRVLRHLYTRNFAFLLYKCIAQVSQLAEARDAINASASPPVEHTSAAARTRLETSLRILQRLMPVALEDGTAPQAAAPTGAQQTPSEQPSAPPAPQGGDSGGGNQPSLEEASNRSRTRATAHFQRLFFVEGKTCDDAKPDETFPLFPHQTSASSEHTLTLASYLGWAVVECCFIRHITIPGKTRVPPSPLLSVTHSEVHQDLVWYAGIATEETPNGPAKTGASFVANMKVSAATHTTRKELLTTLVGVLGTPLYHPVGFRDELFTEPLISTSIVPLLPTLAVSLLNAVLTYVPYGSVPYSSYLVSDEENVIVVGARLLCALLCYPGAPVIEVAPESAVTVANGAQALQTLATSEQPSSSPVFEPEGEGETDAETKRAGAEPTASALSGSVKTRAERLMASDPDAPPSPLQDPPIQPPSPPPPPAPPGRGGAVRRIHSVRKTVFETTFTEAGLLLRKLRPIIGLKMYVRQTILPDSQRGLASHDDFMMLLWKLIDLSPAVCSIFTTDPTVLTYILPLIEYAMDARGNPSRTHRMQLVLFILLRLSSARSFAIRCNQPFTEFIPFPFPPLAESHSYNDVIVVALCVLTDLNEASFAGLLPSCATVLANLAPYIALLGRTASAHLAASLAHVAQRCLRTREPVCDERDGVILIDLCESAASVLQYNQAGSHHLIVALAQHRNLIQKMVDVFLVHKTKRASTRSSLPLLVDTLQAAVAAAQPLIESTRLAGSAGGQEAIVATTTSSSAVLSGLKYDQDAAVAKLKELTLVGVLPTPHRIIVRRFQSTRETEEWATVTSWMTCYMDSPLGYAGDNVSIKLFEFEQPAPTRVLGSSRQGS